MLILLAISWNSFSPLETFFCVRFLPVSKLLRRLTYSIVIAVSSSSSFQRYKPKELILVVPVNFSLKKFKTSSSINLAFSLTSCEWRAERDRIFAEVDKIEKHSDYAIITDYEYVTSTEKIAFKDLVKNRIVNDGRTIEASHGRFDRVGDFIVFSLPLCLA